MTIPGLAFWLGWAASDSNVFGDHNSVGLVLLFAAAAAFVFVFWVRKLWIMQRFNQAYGRVHSRPAIVHGRPAMKRQRRQKEEPVIRTLFGPR